jgi:hypothetical protein
MYVLLPYGVQVPPIVDKRLPGYVTETTVVADVEDWKRAIAGYPWSQDTWLEHTGERRATHAHRPASLRLTCCACDKCDKCSPCAVCCVLCGASAGSGLSD